MDTLIQFLLALSAFLASLGLLAIGLAVNTTAQGLREAFRARKALQRPARRRPYRAPAGSPPIAMDPRGVPVGIAKLADAESEAWATQDILAKAKSLYDDCGDWRQVESRMRQTVTDPVTPGETQEAAERAWSPEVVR